MNVLEILRDYNIPYVTESHRHAREGWVNTKCPYCHGHDGFHLGWNLTEHFWTCFRCGWKPPVKTLAAILGFNLPETYEILKRYGTTYQTPKKAGKTKEKPLILPSKLKPLTKSHKHYLWLRGFDPDYIEEKYHLQSTTIFSKVEEVSYKHRIFIPIYWNSQLVTFDSRDVTDRAENKYQACPVDREIMHRKHIIYGNQEAWEDGIGICVEGPADVWRFGDKSFATCGINFKQEQVRCISKIFHTVFIVYDSEIQAQQQARKLRAELRMRGVKAEVVPLKTGDPGELMQRKADAFVKNLLGS